MSRQARSGFVGAAIAAGLVLTLAAPARADDDASESVAGQPYPFRYRTPMPAHRIRAAIEELGVFGIGLAEYFINAGVNSRDWDLGYDWPSLRSKFTGEAISFDTNRFDTNWVSHAIGGYGYYQVARGNRLSLAESVAYTAAASTVWEYVGELRENASVNDLIATPLMGIVLGETTTQLGAFFHRSRPTPLSGGLGLLFAPGKSLHDAIDGAAPERASSYDDLGLAADVAHAFRVYGGSGVTRQTPATGATRSYVDINVGVDARLTNLPAWGRAGSAAGVFEDGNVSRLALDVTFNDVRLADLAFDAYLVPTGYFRRAVARDAAGRLRGSQEWIGLGMDFSYDAHRYDRERQDLDRISAVSLGLGAEHESFFGPFTVRTELGILGRLAGVGSLALARYRAAADVDQLTAVLRQEEYYFATGGSVVPSVSLAAVGFELRVHGRFDVFDEITWAERSSSAEGAPRARDLRTSFGASCAYELTRRLRPRLWARRLERTSDLGPFHARAEDLSFGAALDLEL